MKKKRLITIMVICLATALLLSACSTVSNEPSSNTTQDNGPTTSVVTLTTSNYANYFNIEVTYSGFYTKVSNDKTILGVWVPGYSQASAKQMIRITPKNNVVSCDNVSFTIIADTDYYWTYNSENSGKYTENKNEPGWTIKLDSDGTFYDSKMMYYFKHVDTTKATCPSDSKWLTFATDGTGLVSGSVTVNQ